MWTLSPHILDAFPRNWELFVVSEGWVVIGDSQTYGASGKERPDYQEYKVHPTEPRAGESHRRSTVTQKASFSLKGQRPRGRPQELMTSLDQSGRFAALHRCWVSSWIKCLPGGGVAAFSKISPLHEMLPLNTGQISHVTLNNITRTHHRKLHWWLGCVADISILYCDRKGLSWCCPSKVNSISGQMK